LSSTAHKTGNHWLPDEAILLAAIAVEAIEALWAASACLRHPVRQGKAAYQRTAFQLVEIAQLPGSGPVQGR